MTNDEKKDLGDAEFVQESKIKVIVRCLRNPELLKSLFFSNIFQLLPIWVMLLVQWITEFMFEIDNYICNLLVFVVIACVSNICDLLEEDNIKRSKESILWMLFISFGILCIASIFYSLILLKEIVALKIRMDYLKGCSLTFALIACFISLYQKVSEKGK